MKRFTRIIGVTLLALVLGTMCSPLASAGRTGGPWQEIATAPVHNSIFFEFSFNAMEPATVTIEGNGRTNLQLFVYDGDGHTATGVGFGDHWTATMEVYRAGTFRVEVRNLGPLPNTFKLVTN